MARKKLPYGLAALAALLLLGIGVSLKAEVQDENKNTLASAEIENGKIKTEQNQQGIQQSLQDSFIRLLNQTGIGK